MRFDRNFFQLFACRIKGGIKAVNITLQALIKLAYFMFDGGSHFLGPGDIHAFFAHAAGRLYSCAESRGRTGADRLAAQEGAQDGRSKRNHGFHFFGFGLLLFPLQRLFSAHQPVAERGEPRGKRKRSADPQALGLGDCIDCTMCVQVCPTGIDIRNGLQIQCISCALCIDACDAIMDSLGWERGLVAYTSERQAEEGRRARLLRPKVLGYFIVLLVIVAALAWNVSHQQLFDLSVAQERLPLYVTLSDGRIQNSYEFKMNNKTGGPLELEFEVVGLEGAELDLGNFSHVELAPDQRLRLRAHIKYDPEAAESGSQPFRIRAVPVNRSDLQPFEKDAVFSWPGGN